MKRNALIATVLGVVVLSAGFQTVYAETAPPTFEQVVCSSTTPKNYEIDPATEGSVYNWDIIGGEEGTDWSIDSKTGTSVNVVWTTVGDYTFWSQETNKYSCIGPKTQITVTVSPYPIVDPVSNNICSATQGLSGTSVDVVDVELPQSNNGVEVTMWSITKIDIPSDVTPGEGNTGEGDKTTSYAIMYDAYTNASADPVDVVYHVTPYAGECPGPEFLITITVYPEVKAPTIRF